MTILSPTVTRGTHVAGVTRITEVTDVEWARTQQVRVEMKLAALDRGLLVVVGDVGTGKSFSVARAAERCGDVVDEVVWLELSSNVRGRALLADLYPDLAGGEAPKGDTETQLMAGLHLAASDRHRLVIVDEAQHVTLQAMHALRGLHSHPDADFGLVLVGTPLLEKRMPPEIRSRRTGRVSLDRMTATEAPGVLAAYHPRYAAADPTVLAEANQRYARGEFRWWAKLLVRIHRHLADDVELTMGVISELNDRGL